MKKKVALITGGVGGNTRSFNFANLAAETLSFDEPAAELVITSELIVRRYGYDAPVDRLARHTGALHEGFDRVSRQIVGSNGCE